MDANGIKSQFPIFSKKINGKPLVYLDSSNSSQKPISVINRLNDFYKNEFSNIGRSIHSLAVSATNKFEETRISVKNLINAKGKWRLSPIDNNLIQVSYLWNGELRGDFPSWSLSKAWIKHANEVLGNLKTKLEENSVQ